MPTSPSSSSGGINFKEGKRFIDFFSFFGMKLLLDDINNIS